MSPEPKASMFRGVLQELSIASISEHLASGSTEPRVIDFSMQQLKKLDDLQTSTPFTASELDLHGNFVTTIHPNFFAAFSGLRILHLGIGNFSLNF